MNFEKEYWSEVYSNRLIDGTFNAHKHADYIKSIFALSDFTVRSIIDIGFGKAKLLEQVVKKMYPELIIAIDPSKLMVDSLKKKTWIARHNLAILNTKFEEFNPDYLQKFPVDLAITNSVFQYIQNIEENLKKLASIARFSYFSVPTKLDYLRMEKELNFRDKYAFVRTKKLYIKLLNKYFTRVSFNILESKLVNEHTYFYAELYRE